MNLDLSKRWAARWEDRRAFAYDDATGEPIHPGRKILGNPTVGVGLNLYTSAARINIVGLGLDFAAVLAGELALTDAQIDTLLELSLRTAIGGARALFPAFDSVPENQQIILTDLSFNMGVGKLATFTQMVGFVRNQMWTEAAGALRNSKWFHQVGEEMNQRGGANVAVLGNKATPEYILSGQ